MNNSIEEDKKNKMVIFPIPKYKKSITVTAQVP